MPTTLPPQRLSITRAHLPGEVRPSPLRNRSHTKRKGATGGYALDDNVASTFRPRPSGGEVPWVRRSETRVFDALRSGVTCVDPGRHSAQCVSTHYPWVVGSSPTRPTGPDLRSRPLRRAAGALGSHHADAAADRRSAGVQVTGHTSSHSSRLPRSALGLRHMPQDLARRALRDLLDELDGAHLLARRDPFGDVRHQLIGRHLLRGHDVGLRGISAGGVAMARTAAPSTSGCSAAPPPAPRAPPGPLVLDQLLERWQERGERDADSTASGPPEGRDLLGRQRPRPPPVEQQVDAGGLLEFLDGIGGRREVGGRDDRPVVGQQHGV